MTATDLTQCTATDLLDRYRGGAASPVEATEAVLARIERLDPALNAFCLVDGDRALEAARASEDRWRRACRPGPSTASRRRSRISC